MKVWYGITTAQYKKYRPIYLKIRNHLLDQGIILTHDWYPPVEKEFRNKIGKERDMKAIYENILRSIENADAVIIEYTIPNFSTAHQITYALQKKKPTLVLRLKKDNPNFSDSYLEALNSKLLHIKEYDLKNYKTIIDNFLGITQLGTNTKRYNIVLEKKHDYYLDWYANERGISRSAALREIIEKNINESEITLFN